MKDVNPRLIRPELIREAAAMIKDGRVVVFPTTGLYGLGADALNPEAVDKVFNIKLRPYQNPILVLIEKRCDLDRLVQKVPPAAVRLMDYFWPGAVTIVFGAKENLPANLTAGTGRIGVRMPGHPVAFELVKAVGGPITGTSANISGQPGCSDILQLAPSIAERVDLILDAGALAGGKGSTVIDVTEHEPRVLREGAVSERDVFVVLNQNQTQLY